MVKRFVVLDRDGTLIVEKNYLASPEGVELLPGAAEGVRRLRADGFGLVVITNQSGVGRGYFGFEDVVRVHARVEELLGAEVDGFYVCPHGPEDGCDCRKPRTGLMLRSAAELGFDPAESVVVGDKASDVEFGRACGARTILVLTGYGREHLARGAKPDAVAEDLAAAARMIVDGY